MRNGPVEFLGLFAGADRIDLREFARRAAAGQRAQQLGALGQTEDSGTSQPDGAGPIANWINPFDEYPKFIAGGFIDRSNQFGQQGNYELALDDLIQASRLLPERIDLDCHLGHAYMLVGRTDMALRLMTLAIAKDPKLALGYRARGKLQLYLCDAASAVADFREALHRGTDLKEWEGDASLFALTLNELGDWSAAEAEWSAIIAANPDRPQAYQFRAEARRQLGDTDGAESDLRVLRSLQRRAS